MKLRPLIAAMIVMSGFASSSAFAIAGPSSVSFSDGSTLNPQNYANTTASQNICGGSVDACSKGPYSGTTEFDITFTNPGILNTSFSRSFTPDAQFSSSNFSYIITGPNSSASVLGGGSPWSPIDAAFLAGVYKVAVTYAFEANGAGSARWSMDLTTAPAPVPAPASLALLGIGLAAIGMGRRRKV